MESYFDLVICTMINILALYQTKNNQEFKSFFETPLDATCSTMALIYSFLFFAYPIWGAVKIVMNQGKLGQKKIKDELGPLLDGIKLDHFHTSMYNIYFLVRRLLTGIGLVVLRYHPFFQSYFLMIFSWINFMYQ